MSVVVVVSLLVTAPFLLSSHLPTLSSPRSVIPTAKVAFVALLLLPTRLNTSCALENNVLPNAIPDILAPSFVAPVCGSPASGKARDRVAILNPL